MAVTSYLKKQVDMPVWEWCRLAPGVSAALSATCTADNSLYHVSFGRYIYFMHSVPTAAAGAGGTSVTGFFRYDTISDTYQSLAWPPIPPATLTGMQFAGGQGYNGRVIAGGANFIQAAALTSKTLKTFDIRIIGGTGAGQQRIITDVADPVIAYAGTVTTLPVTPQATVIDANANWQINQWVGYQVRFMHVSGQSQVRKIIYNSSNTLYFSDVAKFAEDQWAWSPITTITGSVIVIGAVGTPYQIESSIIIVDTNWTTIPDETSRFMVRAGGIWMISTGTTYTLQYYDVAADQWYVRNASAAAGPVTAAGTDVTIVNAGENAVVWERGTALGAHTATTLQDTAKTWVADQWVGYNMRIYSGTGENKFIDIIDNTANTLIFGSLTDLAPATVASASGVSGTYVVTTAVATPVNCNGWSITGTGIDAGAKIVSGQGTTSLFLTVLNSTTVSGDLVLGIAATGTNAAYTIATTTPTPINCNGLSISGTGIGTGAKIVSGQGTSNLTLSVANSNTVSGMITLWLSVTAASGTTGQYTITLNAATPAPTNCNGWQITGTGIGAGATIVSGQGTTSLTLSVVNANTVSGDLKISFIPDVTSKYFIEAFDGGIVTNFIPPTPKVATTVMAVSGTAGTANVVTAIPTPVNCNGWYISGTGITDGTTTILSGQGTTNLVLSANNISPGVSGLLIISPTNISATAAGGTAGQYTITTNPAVPANCNGWYISGAGIAPGTTIVSGQNSTTLILSLANTATVSGTLYLYLIIPTPAVFSTTATGTSGQTTIVTGVAAPANCLGWYASGTGIAQNAIIVTQSTTTLTLSIANANTVSGTVILSPTIATATTASGVAGACVVTTSATVPPNCNGWYISGTGIALGATIFSGQGTTTLTLSLTNTATVSGTLTLSATALSTGSIINSVFTAGATTGAYYPGQILQGNSVMSTNSITSPAGACYTTGAVATVNFATSAGGTTAGILPGMIVTVLAGTTGAITAGTYVLSITNSTTLVLSAAVATQLRDATLQFTMGWASTAATSSSIATLVTVTGTVGTAGLYPGMYVTVTSAAATGVFVAGTYVTAVNSTTTFTVSQAPSTALASATVVASPFQTVITNQLSGVSGGAGNYTIFPQQTVASTAIIGTGTSILTDSTKCWGLNRWNNYAVRIKAGTGMNQARSILGTVAGQVTYTSAATTASSVDTLVTLASGDTSNIVVGMVVNVTAGTGVFVFGTTVTVINNATQFTISATPTTALASATVTGAPVNTLITYPAWTITPDTTSRYVIHGDSDKNYFSLATQTPTFIHNIEIDTVTMGRALDFGAARGVSAQYADHPPVAISAGVPVIPIVSAVGYVAAVATLTATSSGGIATVTFSSSSVFPIGSWITISTAIVPAGFRGTYQVTNSSQGSVSFWNATAGPQTTAGTILQCNSIVLGGTLANGGWSALGDATTMNIFGCVPTTYNANAIVVTGRDNTPTTTLGGYQGTASAGSTGTTITVDSTTNLKVGMIPTITAGGGSFLTGTVVVTVSVGSFTVSQNAAINLDSVITVVPTIAWAAGTSLGNLTTAGFVQKVPQATTGTSTYSGTTVTLYFTNTIFAVGSWVHVAGCTPAVYNGVYQVVTAAAGNITYVVPVAPTGNLTVQGTVGLATPTMLATTVNNYSFHAGQYVTIQGDTGFSANNTNITALITPVPGTVGTATPQFTYPVAAPSGAMVVYPQFTTQLRDASKNWVPNQWAGCLVTYNPIQMTAAYVQPSLVAAYILANTTNTLIFTAAQTIPAQGISRYVITSPATSQFGAALGSVDGGLALGVQSTTALQDVTKGWQTPAAITTYTGTTNGTATVTVMTSVAGLYPGMLVAVTGNFAVTVPAGTTISSITNSTTIVLSQAVTGSVALVAFSFLATCNSTAGSTTITVSGYTTLGLAVGMYVGLANVANLSPQVTTAGAFVANGGTALTTVTVASIISATQFTVSAVPAIPLVNATVQASFWIPGSLYNRRVRVTTGATTNFIEAIITSNTINSLGFTAVTSFTAVHGVTGYTILQQPNRGLGTSLFWNYGASDVNRRGAYLYQARGGLLPGWDRLNFKTDKWEFLTPTPNWEGLGTGAMYAYDGVDRIYYTVGVTQRAYYFDTENMVIHGAGQYPYVAGTATVGNRMEIFETVDGLKYLWLNRHSGQECFRQLLWY